MARTEADLESYIRPPRRRRAAIGCLPLLLLALVILLVTVAVGVKTPRGCELIADWLQSRTGLGLTIAEGRLGLPFDLVLHDVAIRREQAPEGDFRAKEIRLGWRPGRYRLEVSGMRLDLVRVADGWQPEVFGRVAELRDVRETADLFADTPAGLEVKVRDGAIFWHTGAGGTRSFVQGLHFWSGAMETPKGRARWYDLDALVVRREDGVDGRSVQRTWVSLQGVPYAEILYRGVWEGDIRRVKDWWSSPEVR